MFVFTKYWRLVSKLSIFPISDPKRKKEDEIRKEAEKERGKKWPKRALFADSSDVIQAWHRFLVAEKEWKLIEQTVVNAARGVVPSCFSSILIGGPGEGWSFGKEVKCETLKDFTSKHGKNRLDFGEEGKVVSAADDITPFGCRIKLHIRLWTL